MVLQLGLSYIWRVPGPYDEEEPFVLRHRVAIGVVAFVVILIVLGLMESCLLAVTTHTGA